jgi:signal recognition particle GTPase
MREERDTLSFKSLIASEGSDRKTDKRDRKTDGDSKPHKRERSRENEKTSLHKRPPEDENNERPAKQSYFRKKIRWNYEDKMIKTKYFRVNDEIIADGLTETQIHDIKDRLIKESMSLSSSDRVAKNVNRRLIQIDNTIRGNFSAENVNWSKPKGN